MNIETLSHPPKTSAITDSRVGETANSEPPSQAEPPDNGIIVTTSSLPPCGLPTEVWTHIFSYLSDFDLLRSVIPVNRFFRTLAYVVGFRNLFDLQSGNFWWIYDFSAAFLRAIPTPKKLQFKFSDEYVCLVDRDLPQQCLQLLENVQSGVESLKFDNFPASLLKVDSLKFPKLKELSIDDEHLSEGELEALGRFVDAIAPQLKTLRINFEPWYYPWFLKKLDQVSSIKSLTIRCPGKFIPSFSSALRCLVALCLENGYNSPDHALVHLRWLFQHYPNLKDLELCFMEVVTDDVDFQAPKLKSLSFDMCEIRSTAKDEDGRPLPMLRHFPNLEKLSVDLSDFYEIAGTHPHLSKLKELSVDECHGLDIDFWSLERGLALCGGLNKLALYPGRDADMLDFDYDDMLMLFKMPSAPYELLPSSVDLESYTCRFPKGAEIAPDSSFPSHWIYLEVLNLGVVDVDHLVEVCDQFVGLRKLVAGLNSFREISEFLSYLGEGGWNVEELYLSCEERVEGAEAGFWNKKRKGFFVDALNLVRQLVSSCHSALPRSDDAILNQYPKLKEFTFSFSASDDFSFQYIILRTCIGQVIRLIRWSGSLGPCAYNGNCHQVPSSHWLEGGDGLRLPKAFCDDMHCLEFLLTRDHDATARDEADNDNEKIFVSDTGDAGLVDLAFYFKNFGVLKSVDVLDEEKNPRGSGYVVFEDESAIEEVMAQDSHTLRNGTTVKVTRVMQSRSEASEGEK